MKKLPNLRDLIDAGQLKREPKAGSDQVARLIERARKDLESAHRLLDGDPAGAMDLIYKAYFHAANALLRQFGYRPGAVRQHIGVLTATERILGDEHDQLIALFDRLRKRRNEFEYQAVFEMGRTDLDLTFDAANRFLELVQKQLSKSKMGER